MVRVASPRAARGMSIFQHTIGGHPVTGNDLMVRIAIAFILAATAPATALSQPPNIVLILADDK